MLTHLWAFVAAAALPLVVVISNAHGDARDCPSGTSPVSIGTGVICVVVQDPGVPDQPGDGGSPDEAVSQPAGCHRSDGTNVPCQTADGYWWSGSQCYAAPYDAPPGHPAWGGHTDGSVWACTRCAIATGNATTCTVEFIWLPPGVEPGPPTPGELAQTALGQLPLAAADLHTAPSAPDPTYVNVENWLWVPQSQWVSLTKSVSAGGTTVTVTAEPSQVTWTAGAKQVTCRGPGKEWSKGMSDAATTTCGVTFERTSSGQPGGVFDITASIRYAVTWVCTGACSTASGDLGLVDGPASRSQIRVLQRQTVVVE